MKTTAAAVLFLLSLGAGVLALLAIWPLHLPGLQLAEGAAASRDEVYAASARLMKASGWMLFAAMVVDHIYPAWAALITAYAAVEAVLIIIAAWLAQVQATCYTLAVAAPVAFTIFFGAMHLLL